MRMALRFVLPLLLVLGLIAWLAAPAVGGLIEKWFRADVEMRSHLIFNSVQETVTQLVNSGSSRQVDVLFRRIAQDERVLALGLCDNDGKLVRRSAAWPASLACPEGHGNLGQPSFTVAPLDNGSVLAASFGLVTDGNALGRLVILHDLGFIERRLSSAESYLAVFLGLLGLAAAGVTAIVARLTLRGWITSLQRGLTAPSGDGAGRGDDPELAPLLREMRKAMRSLEAPRGLSDAIRVDWGPESLRSLLRAEMPDAEVLVVSNRQPYIHNMEDGKVTLQRPASGLVTALEPIMRACGGTWIAHGSGSADSLMVDKSDHLAVPPDAPTYTLRRVWLSDEEQDGYYYGLANEGLWPLCHIAFVRPVFRASDWAQYVAVNRKFADAVVAEATTPNPVVLVQDYHFALLPQMVRER
ncbi:MAG: trehalose-6-phosphate synthase, partial [Magnetospirillum sp.]|nr:trehalose-6-phosphate synthase [Magnetospirillum sp.]